MKGAKQQFTGVSTYGDGILTLAQETGPALVGRVGWKDVRHMTFHVVGDGPDDPGLSFAKEEGDESKVRKILLPLQFASRSSTPLIEDGQANCPKSG